MLFVFIFGVGVKSQIVRFLIFLGCSQDRQFCKNAGWLAGAWHRQGLEAPCRWGVGVYSRNRCLVGVGENYDRVSEFTGFV